MSTPVCVCLSEVALYWGPAPELGTSDARGRVTSPAEKNKTSRPAPVSWAWPLHDDVWRCTLSAFVSAPSSGPPPPSCLQGWRMSFEPEATVHFCLPPVAENGPLPSASSQQIRCSASSLSFYFLPADGYNPLASSLSFFLLPAFIPRFSQHFSPFCQPETRFLLNSDSVLTVAEFRLGAENEGCCQKV